MKSTFIAIRAWFFISLILLIMAYVTINEPIKLTTAWIFEAALIVCMAVVFIIAEAK